MGMGMEVASGFGRSGSEEGAKGSKGSRKGSKGGTKPGSKGSKSKGENTRMISPLAPIPADLTGHSTSPTPAIGGFNGGGGDSVGFTVPRAQSPPPLMSQNVSRSKLAISIPESVPADEVKAHVGKFGQIRHWMQSKHVAMFEYENPVSAQQLRANLIMKDSNGEAQLHTQELSLE